MNCAIETVDGVEPARSRAWLVSGFCFLRAFASVAVASMLTACASPREELLQAQAIAAKGQLKRMEFAHAGFSLLAFVKVEKPGLPLVVYLEGDGNAWSSSQEISHDPTPSNPLALQLAALDTAPNVAWLARPCQYLRLSSPACRPAYWDERRYSAELVAVMDHAASKAAGIAQAGRLELVGYSGGGAMAVLLADLRSDVASIRTLAGNLDIKRFTSIHQVSPLLGSLDPAEAALRLASLPQIHWVGQADRVVPAEIAASYIQATGDVRCLRVVIVPGIQHAKGWVEFWPQALQAIPTCRLD